MPSAALPVWFHRSLGWVSLAGEPGPVGPRTAFATACSAISALIVTGAGHSAFVPELAHLQRGDAPIPLLVAQREWTAAP